MSWRHKMNTENWGCMRVLNNIISLINQNTDKNSLILIENFIENWKKKNNEMRKQNMKFCL